MTPGEKYSVLIYLFMLAAWNMCLTVAILRNAGLIHRLDAVLSDALTALGFPKKVKP